MNKLWAFVKKEFLIEIRYRFHFIFRLIRVLLVCSIYYFLSKLVDASNNPLLVSFKGNYFNFVIVGIAFFSFLRTGLSVYTDEIIRSMNTGTLEAMIASPTSPNSIIILPSIGKYIFTLFEVFLYMLFGFLFFGVKFANPNYIGAIIFLALMLVSFSGLGLISASLLVLVKRGDPINWIISQVSFFLGGVLFPIEILPNWLKIFSYMLPITYSLRGIRHALIDGWSISNLLPDILILAVFSIIIFPVGLWVCNYMIRRAKQTGAIAYGG